MELNLLLHNVRSAYNVGSIFRTADAAGVSKIYLVGLTPTPVDRFDRKNKEIAKTALGAEKYIPWENMRSIRALFSKLKKDGWYIVGVEQDEAARDYRVVRPRKKVVFVFGNEVRGLPISVRNECDTLVHIPMRGNKESLNVSVAAGVILFGCQSRTNS